MATDKSCIQLFLVIICILPLASADLGPKPATLFHIYYHNQLLTGEDIKARMLSCTLETRYEPLMTELSQYSPSAQHDKCLEIAPQYGLDPESVCYSVLSMYLSATNAGSGTDCKDDLGTCAMFSAIRIQDDARNCFWSVHRLAWVSYQVYAVGFSYMLPDQFRLAIYLTGENRTVISDAIDRTSFDSEYTVTIPDSGQAAIVETTSIPNRLELWLFAKALLLTLITELVIAALFISVIRAELKPILLTVIIGNLISLPIVWYTIIRGQGIPAATLFAETFAFVFEALLIFFLNRKSMSLQRSFLLSFIMNAVSFLMGFFSLVMMAG